ncbi:MAG TPA: septum site-determining protein MinD [Clostridia bacterium]|nr:septum site-determining protein MinD [Clostridia bacterium]
MRKIVVTSGKGGVGKTTVCATLGRALSDMGQRVVLVDADVGLNNLDVVLALENRVVYDIVDVITGRCKVSQALIQDLESGLMVLSSSSENPVVTAQSFRGVIDSLVDYDYILIDCPAGIENGFHRAVSSAQEAIVITTPSISAIRDADKVLSILAGYSLNTVNIVVNRVRADMVTKGEMMSPSDIARLLRTPPVGIIPEDDCITLYSQVGRVPDFALSDKAFRLLAENLHFGCKKLFDLTRAQKGFWSKFRQKTVR